MTEAESFGDSFVMDKYVSDVRFKFEVATVTVL